MSASTEFAKQRPQRHPIELTAVVVLLVIATAATFTFAADGSAALALGGIAALVIGVVAVLFPQIGLVALVAVTIGNVSDNFITYLGLPSIAKLVAPGLVFVLLVRWALYRERPFFHFGAFALMSGFLLLMLLSVAPAMNWVAAQNVVEDFAKELIIATLALAFIGRIGGFQTLIWSAVVTAGALCALGAAKYIIGNFGHEYYGFAQIVEANYRFAGSIGDPNFFGAILVFMVPLSLQIALSSESATEKVLGFALLALVLFGLIMTKSRGALVAMVISLAVLAMFLNRRQLGWLFAACVLGVLALGALLSEELVARFASILETAQAGEALDPAVEGRLASWTVARQLFLDNPLFGVGSGNFNSYYQDYALELGLIFRGEGRSAHSLYLEILAELGLVGLGWFLLIAAIALASVFRAARAAKRAGFSHLAIQYGAFGAGLTGYLVAMAFLHDSFPRFLWLVLAAAIALPSVARITIAAPPGAVQDE